MYSSRIFSVRESIIQNWFADKDVIPKINSVYIYWLSAAVYNINLRKISFGSYFWFLRSSYIVTITFRFLLSFFFFFTFFFLVKRDCSFKVYSISLLVFGRSKKNNNKVERLYWKNISIISKILYKGLKLCLFLKIIKQDKLLSLKWNKLCIYFLNSYKKIDSFCFGRERKISINRWWL